MAPKDSSSIDVQLFAHLESLYRALRLASQDVLFVGTGDQRHYFFHQQAQTEFKNRVERYAADVYASYSFHCRVVLEWDSLVKAARDSNRERTVWHLSSLCGIIDPYYVHLIDIHQHRAGREHFLHYPYYVPDRKPRSDPLTRGLPDCNPTHTKEGLLGYLHPLRHGLVPQFREQRKAVIHAGINFSDEEGYKAALHFTKMQLEQFHFDVEKPGIGLLPTMSD